MGGVFPRPHHRVPDPARRRRPAVHDPRGAMRSAVPRGWPQSDLGLHRWGDRPRVLHVPPRPVGTVQPTGEESDHVSKRWEIWI